MEKKVPNKRHKDYEGDIDYEVSHEILLYTARTNSCKKSLDKAKNMKTQPKSRHRKRHKKSGDQYHEYDPANNHKLVKTID